MKIPRNAISFQEQIHVKIGKNTTRISKITNKDIYWIFVKNIQVEPIITTRLLEQIDTPNEHIGDIFTLTRAVRNTKIKAFQYKVLYNLIPCNQYLKRIKKSETELCNRCQMVDTTSHYLYECQEVKLFWNSLKRWWDSMEMDMATFDINVKNIMLGILGNNPKNEVLNACILLAKWHIYKNKLNESQIFFYKFLCDLKLFLIIEKTIALRSNTYQKYVEKWQHFEDILT
jgi:hypothetical protein